MSPDLGYVDLPDLQRNWIMIIKRTMLSDRILTIAAGQYGRNGNVGVLGSVRVVATEIEWYAQRG